jgi:hypothetical protein
MKKVTLQDQYLLIKGGKGHKGVFLNEVKRDYPNLIRNAATFEEASKILKDKNIISENFVGLQAINQMTPTAKQPYEIAYANFLKEAKKKDDDAKAEEKKPSKQVETAGGKTFDNTDMKNIDNLIFDQVMTGYYAELKDPKNADKTMEELKAIVMKNLSKDSIYYTKDGQFGVKDLGYSVEHPGLGEPKEAKGKHKASGYGDLKEGIGKTYPDEISGEYEGKSVITPGADLYELLNDILEIAISEDDFVNKVAYALTDETSNLSAQDEHKLRTWYSSKNKQTENMHITEAGSFDQESFKNKLMDMERPYSKDKAALSAIQDIYSSHIQSLNSISQGLNEDMSIEESKLRTAIKSIIREELSKVAINENLPKRLKEIENESVNEVKVAKLDKLKAEIEKRQSQLDMIETNEDLKGLTDGKKVKALQKEIKLLERAVAKLEKTIKGTKKEVIDEVGDSEDQPEYVKDALARQDAGEDLESILNDYSPEEGEEIKNYTQTEDAWKDADINDNL